MKITKKFTTKKKIITLITLSVISFIVFGLAIYYSWNPWLFLTFLSGIGFGNWSGSINEADKWNKGVCRASGKPWEFSESEMFSDESMTYCFDSGKYSFCTQFLDATKMLRQYKGIKKIR